MTQRGYKMIEPTFNKRLPINLDLLKKRIYELKKASLMIIDGYQGEGKSTLAVQVAEYYQQEELDFNIQYAIGGKDFQTKFDACIEQKKQVIIYDEAGDFDKFSTYTEFNKTMSQFFRTFRTFKIFIILVLPNFNDLDPRIFKNGVPRLLLHCHRKSETRGYFNAYSLWRMEHLRLKLRVMSQKILPQEVYKYVRPNFKGEFYDLEEAKRIKLDELSTKGKEDIKANGRIKEAGLITIKQLSLGLGLEAGKYFFKSYLKNKITKLKGIIKTKEKLKEDLAGLSGLGGYLTPIEHTYNEVTTPPNSTNSTNTDEDKTTKVIDKNKVLYSIKSFNFERKKNKTIDSLYMEFGLKVDEILDILKAEGLIFESPAGCFNYV
jgi:energy-coupling factor transporter ATP-binding protein EcfA2